LTFFRLICNLFLISIVFTACDDKMVTKEYIKNLKHLKIDSISLESPYKNIQKKIILALKNENLKINENSIYIIKVDYTDYKKICNNPMTSAYDATFDGFIRLTLFKKGTRIYMCQKEFRGKLDVDDFEKLLSQMKNELNF